ncbi:MAG: HD-GYP domain-containing protein [Clostridia bacterium]|nr:HD-GYP domain-containing protein [Clostridia bacterium]
MKNEHGKKSAVVFISILIFAIAFFVVSVIKTNTYNSTKRHATFAGPGLFSSESEKEVSVSAVARSSTWGKIFDFDHVGLSKNNYQAYTYDFLVTNNTKDQVADFSFRLTFSQDAYLASAWNGALEIHQNVAGGGEELVDTVPDLREFVPEDYALDTVTVDGESFIAMKAGDYLIYKPSSTMNAMEVPIEPHEGTTPGIIMYVAIGESVEESTLELEYMFHRLLTGEPLFWVSLVCMGVWLITLIIFITTSLQIRKYKKRHERDNVIINESIETFTGFIDAKDPYTNGHSKRVAIYTKRIAQEMGYEGEELDRIYYIALLHDCGKIGVPDNILGKPGKLTDEEFKIIQSHTVRGGEILSSFKSLENVSEGARYHHERYDGKGYPEGKAGKDIPLIARMICVADSFDAMNTDRVYRKKLSRDRIIHEIEINKGGQFDPQIADIMLRFLREGKIPTEK